MHDKSRPHFVGHRSRLKERFNQMPSALHDYEILELVLFWSLPRKDTKPLAKLLLKEFGTLANLLHADLDKILTFKEVTKSIHTNFTIIRELLNRVLKNNVINKHIISSWSALLEYLQSVMGNLKTEQFRILFLNKKNMIISDEIQSQGTVDQTSVYTREVVKRALFHEATAIILTHNHPSGDPTPSKADIELTQDIVQACATFNITVHDHVIISKKKHFSFKSEYLLEKRI